MINTSKENYTGTVLKQISPHIVSFIFKQMKKRMMFNRTTSVLAVTDLTLMATVAIMVSVTLVDYPAGFRQLN
jgi:hypothetical protein